jgi:hypothetical protein
LAFSIIEVKVSVLCSGEKKGAIGTTPVTVSGEYFAK